MKGMSEGERLSMLSSPSSPGARRGVSGQSLARIRLKKGSEMAEGSGAKFALSYSSKLPQADPADEGAYPDEDIEEQTITEEEIGVLEEIAEGEAEASEPDEAEEEEAQPRIGEGLAKLVGGDKAEVVDGYHYGRSEQLTIPTMTADAKVGLITSQVQQIEKLVAIMLAVLAVRRDDGTAPYDLWSKALEPAEDAQVLLQGVVKLLKTRNRNRY